MRLHRAIRGAGHRGGHHRPARNTMRCQAFCPGAPGAQESKFQNVTDIAGVLIAHTVSKFTVAAPRQLVFAPA